jgi:di/tricarboxylate transporter
MMWFETILRMTNETGVVGWVRTIDPSWLSLPAGAGAAVLVFAYAPLSERTATMLAIAVFCIGLWIGSPVESWFTGLVCLGAVGVTFSTELALIGFRLPATWLVVFGILLGEATRRSGLTKLIEFRALARMPAHVANDAESAYRFLLIVLSAAAFGLIVLVPSSLVRVLALGPVLVSVGERFTERRARIGLFLGPLFVTYYGATGVLTGSLANIIITGLIESSSGLSIGWIEWAVWLGPVMAVGRSIAVVAVAYVLYRPTDPMAIRESSIETAEITTDQRRMMAFLLVGVVIWATDAIHGLHPLYGALAVTLLVFAPQIGVVTADAVTDADFSIVFFLGAIFAIAEGLQQTGFTDRAAGAILSVLPGDASLVVVLVMVVVGALLLTVLLEGLAAASVLTPTLVSFTASAGIPLLPVAMAEAIALNTYFFPYQSAVFVAILGLNVVNGRELIRMATVCSVVTLVVLLPIQLAVFALVF